MEAAESLGVACQISTSSYWELNGGHGHAEHRDLSAIFEVAFVALLVVDVSVWPWMAAFLASHIGKA